MSGIPVLNDISESAKSLSGEFFVYEPPPLNWSASIARKRRTTDGSQVTKERSVKRRVRIPEDLGGHSTRTWAFIPQHRGHRFHELGQVTDAAMGSSLPKLVKRFRGTHFSSHAISGQSKTMGIVNQAVENGVGQSRVADGLMLPLVNRELTQTEASP